ncbi:MAG: hypothetical protein CMJ67_06940 [Planctomycetaceae bacterium]|nr:hypothetical protein [Planctomycetaceae bacterium]
MKQALCLLVLACPVAFANAQSGNNDDCSNAIEISFGTTGFSTLNASNDGPPLPGDCDEGFGTGFGFDIWFTLTPDQSEGIVVSTCDTADFDTRLAVYTGCNGILVACNDDGPGCGGYTSQMNFDGVEGETYLLRVGGFDNERGTGTISVEYGDGPPETPNIDFQHDGLTRQYRILVPDDLPESAPLVLALHGYGGNNNDMANNYGWRELAAEEGFVVAFPNGTRDQSNARFWDVDYAFHGQFDIDDDGFLSSLAVHLQDTLDLDPERTFVTGFSNGAEMCFQLACRESATFRGFGPVIGMMLDTLWVDCDPEFPRPIITMNGTLDNVTLFGGDMGNSGGWGAYHSIPDMVDFWVDELETPELERVFLDDIDPGDGSTVRLDMYSSLDHGRQLWYYQVNGGGHDWPGQWGNMDIDATREVWEFFKAIEAEEPEEPGEPADLNGDGSVNAADLGYVLAFWGIGNTGGDLNGDGNTDSADIGLILAAWTG